MGLEQSQGFSDTKHNRNHSFYACSGQLIMVKSYECAINESMKYKIKRKKLKQMWMEYKESSKSYNAVSYK